MRPLFPLLLVLAAPALAASPDGNAPDWGYTPADIDQFQDLQWAYAKRLVSHPAGESVDLIEAPDYAWPAPPCKDLGRRRDNDYKDAPEIHAEPTRGSP